MCNGEDCIDVTTLNHIRFADYEDYKKFILSNRKKKNKRIDKESAKNEKDKN